MPVVKKRTAVKMANSRGWSILVCLSMDLILIRVKDIFHTNVTLTLSLSLHFLATSYSALTTVSEEDFQDLDIPDIEVTRVT